MVDAMTSHDVNGNVTCSKPKLGCSWVFLKHATVINAIRPRA